MTTQIFLFMLSCTGSMPHPYVHRFNAGQELPFRVMRLQAEFPKCYDRLLILLCFRALGAEGIEIRLPNNYSKLFYLFCPVRFLSNYGVNSANIGD